jgi:tetratricopeptide (TPR) repeat protein
VSATPLSSSPTGDQLHADGLAAFEAGDHAAAQDLLRRAALEATSAEAINDLAVVMSGLGERAGARTLLEAALTLDPSNDDARENLAAIGRLSDGDAAWRGSATLGGDNPVVPERAYPGMLNPATMSEHAMRYSLALGILARRDILDVGCGTAYGSEMLTWTARRVRGFDLWQPGPGEHPSWPGGAELTYGFDVCRQPLPPAECAVMFEIAEHLDDCPAALRNVFRAVPALLASFPNPQFHGSHLNHHHVNDWTLERFEHELRAAAAETVGRIELTHYHQPHGFPSVLAGRDASAPFWIVLAIPAG